MSFISAFCQTLSSSKHFSVIEWITLLGAGAKIGTNVQIVAFNTLSITITVYAVCDSNLFMKVNYHMQLRVNYHMQFVRVNYCI